MKKLSKEERAGALALIAVSVLIIAGGFCLRSCRSTASEAPPQVSVIYDARQDTAAQSSDEVKREGKRKRKGKGSASGKRGRKKGIRKGSASGKKRDSHRVTPTSAAGANAYRDFLTDTIPIGSQTSNP